LSNDVTEAVVKRLVTEPEACPDTKCLEAAALMHTDAALNLLERGRVAETDSQLQWARWLLALDVRFDDPSSGPQESEQAVAARQVFRHTWLLTVGKLLLPLGYPAKALSYFKDCSEFFPVGSLLAAGSAQELLGSIDGLMSVRSCCGGDKTPWLAGFLPPQPLFSPPWEGPRRRAMRQALGAAEWHYRKAIELEPLLAETHLRLGRVLQRQGKTDWARPELSWVIENSNDSRLLALAHLFLGELEQNRSQLDDAIRHFRLALREEPESQAAQLALSQALHRSGEMKGSAEAARAVLARTESGDIWLAYHLAFPERARAVMERLRGEVRR
jgi:tetratricopeptide (TPR) repeat protein